MKQRSEKVNRRKEWREGEKEGQSTTEENEAMKGDERKGKEK